MRIGNKLLEILYIASFNSTRLDLTRLLEVNFFIQQQQKIIIIARLILHRRIHEYII